MFKRCDAENLMPLPPSPGTPGEGRGGGSSIRNPQSEIRNTHDPLPNPPAAYRERGQDGRQSSRGRSGRIRVLHVINSFEFGGAEAMLRNLLLRCDRTHFEPHVALLIDNLAMAGPVLSAGIPVSMMGMRPGVPDPRGVARLAAHVRRVRPDLIQSWMDHSNLACAVAARAAPRAVLVWGVHHSHHVPGVSKRSTLLTVKACALLSRRGPARIVCCSQRGRSLYEEMGFDPARLTVVPNGFDLAAFRPDPAARAAFRAEIGVGPDAPVVGLAARFDPLKDHPTFLRAAALLAKRRPGARFLLCGGGVEPGNRALTAEVEALGLSAHCRLLGVRRDVARFYNALDVAASSSISEAFPLALGEAMACEVPCVATDVGDSAFILGDTGHVVPPRDPEALAAAWERVLSMPADRRREVGAAARQRITERFELGAVTRRYEALYRGLVTARAAKGRTSGPRFAAAPMGVPGGVAARRDGVGTKCT